MRLIYAIAAILVTALFPTLLLGADEPARPIERTSPEYPEECSQDSENDGEQFVVVLFDITADGSTENIRIDQSTDSCFESAAMEAVREWRYEPRTIDGEPAPQTDVQTRLTFVLETKLSPELEESLARAVARIYPVRCSHDAKDVEYVSLRYDVSVEGTTKNIEVVESSNSCFHVAAVGFVKGMLYEPKIVDGKAVERIGLEFTMTFRLE